MSVRITGVTPSCCKNCLNPVAGTWSQVTLAGSGTFLPIAKGIQIIAAAGGQLAAIDKSDTVLGNSPWTFSGYFQSLNGAVSKVVFGLASVDVANGVSIESSATNWKLTWFNSNGTTSKDLGIPVDTSAHFWKVISNGSTVSVKQGASGTWQSFAIDANFPLGSLSPDAAANSSHGLRLVEYCLTRK